MDLLRIIIAILLPPVGVFLQVGIGKQFWINILLTILGYIPGMVHAVWVIAKYKSDSQRQYGSASRPRGYRRSDNREIKKLTS